jgi:gluconate 2-dehydrogenase gamma chain
MKEIKNCLTVHEERTLTAIAERIFPASDTPGAVEAGAVQYILIALRGAYASQLPFYRSGLRAVNRRARERFGGRFAALSDTDQNTILSEFEAGSVPNWKKAAEFFETLRYHVLEGVFCEPQYGGNKGMLGWRLVDFPGQQFGYAEAYINKRVDLEPLAVDDSEEEGK